MLLVSSARCCSFSFVVDRRSSGPVEAATARVIGAEKKRPASLVTLDMQTAAVCKANQASGGQRRRRCQIHMELMALARGGVGIDAPYK